MTFVEELSYMKPNITCYTTDCHKATAQTSLFKASCAHIKAI
jgi:hypothetical protein